MRNQKKTSLYILVILALTLIFSNIALSTTIGDWEISPDWTISGDWNINPTEPGDVTAPTYSILGHNSSYASKPCLFYCYAQDNVALSHFIFSWNYGAGWSNDTEVSISSNPAWLNVTKTLPDTIGTNIYYCYYVNDTSNNWLITAIDIFTTEMYPTEPVTVVGDTLYFRSDIYTINNQTAYGLDFTNTNTMETKTETASGNITAYFGFRVWIVHRRGDETELTPGTQVGVLVRSGDTSGFQNNTWEISYHSLSLGFEAIKVIVYVKLGTGDWIAKASFISPKLMHTAILSSTWQFSLWTSRTGAATTTASFRFGSSEYASCISGLSLKEPNAYEMMLYLLQSGNFVGAILYPFTMVIGNLFYGLMMLLICVPIYNRYKSLTPIIILFIIFGGAGGIFSLLVPGVGLGLAWIFLLFGLAGLLYKVFR